MNFKIDVVLPVSAEQLWLIFFDVSRIAALIPGCENVVEKELLTSYSATMKQKIGPFKFEVPTEIVVEEREEPTRVRIRATGRDKFTATSIDIQLSVLLEPTQEGGTRLGVDSTLQVAGRLATLGYPVVKKKSEELFTEFERRLRAELEIA
jgi:carbon monoxide dehydrogenase subunit G